MQSRLCFRLLLRQEILRRPFDKYFGKIKQNKNKKGAPPFNLKKCHNTKQSLLEYIPGIIRYRCVPDITDCPKYQQQNVGFAKRPTDLLVLRGIVV